MPDILEKPNISVDKRHHVNWLQFILGIVCISWIDHGIFAYVNTINFAVFFSIFCTWFLFMLYHCGGILKITNKWIVIYTILLWLYSLFSDEAINFMIYISVYFLLIAFISDYYLNKQLKKERKYILCFFLFENIVIAVRTTYICIMDPTFVRNLTGSVDTVSQYSRKFVATFDNIYVYAMLAVFFVILGTESCNRRYKYWSYLISAVFAICVFFSGFSTALFVMVLYILGVLLLKTPRKILLAICVGAIFLVLFRSVIVDVILSLTEMEILPDLTKIKMLNICDVLNGVDSRNQNNTLYSRMRFQRDAINVIFNHPIWGVYGIERYAAESAKLHNHNVWLDLLANFGLLRSAPFFLAIYMAYQHVKKMFSDWKRSPAAHLFFLWIIFGFLNPVNRPPQHLLLILILPVFGCYCKEMEEEKLF